MNLSFPFVLQTRKHIKMLKFIKIEFIIPNRRKIYVFASKTHNILLSDKVIFFAKLEFIF